MSRTQASVHESDGTAKSGERPESRLDRAFSALGDRVNRTLARLEPVATVLGYTVMMWTAVLVAMLMVRGVLSQIA
jgi:hypothetical protein